MFGRKKKDDDNVRRKPEADAPKNESLMDQLRDEMNSSFDDMQSALDDHLAGRSRTRRGGEKPPESVDYPWSSELDVDAEVRGTSPQASDTSRLPDSPRLSSRASQTRGRRDSGTLTGREYQEHMDSQKAQRAGDDGAFDPSTEAAFNTDARNLREYNTKIDAAGGSDTSEVRRAKEAKEQLLQSYREVGHRQDTERNYPNSKHPNFEKSREIQALKEAYKQGHREAEQSPGAPRSSSQRQSPRLSSRASQTAGPSAPGTLTGKDYQNHMDKYKAHLAGKEGAFNPHSEEAFNTDARNLREYNTKIKAARGADTSEVRKAREDKQQLLQTYREVGRRQNVENYPRSNQTEFEQSPEIWTLKEAYREGHREAEEPQDNAELERYTPKDVEEIEALGAEEAAKARDRRSDARQRSSGAKGSRSFSASGIELGRTLHGRQNPLLPPNWEHLSPREQRDYLNQLIEDNRIDPKAVMDLFPKQGGQPGHKDDFRKPVLPRLFSRASQTRRKAGQGTLTGSAFQKHMDRLKGKAKDKFDPKTEAEFNTDAKNLREYNLRIEIAKGADIYEVREAREKKKQLLEAYRKLGHRQEAKKNYPDSRDPNFETTPEIWTLKAAYREGHQEAENQQETSNLDSYTPDDVTELDAVGKDFADWARDERQKAINQRRK